MRFQNRFLLPDNEAREWLNALVSNLCDSAEPVTKATIEEYIEWHTQHSMFHADTARNAALRAIHNDAGVIRFDSPEGDLCITTGTRLTQMLQMDSLSDALDAVDGSILY